MKRFSELYQKLDSTTKTKTKVECLVEYFRSAPAEDAAWAVYFLLGNKISRVAPTSQLRLWLAELSGYPLWLVEESYRAVGDLAETLALLAPRTTTQESTSLAKLVLEELIPLKELPEEEKRAALQQKWQQLSPGECFVFNKMITGGLRVGVSKNLVARALAQVAGLDEAVIAHRLMGTYRPTPESFKQVLSSETTALDAAQPYPFFLAYPLEDGPESLGAESEWHTEWKWDGIRAQLIRRKGVSLIWSRGEEAISDEFPEILAAMQELPVGTVLDGEIVAWNNESPAPFSSLQRRLGRKNVSKKMLSEVPCRFIAYDILEHGGEDIRQLRLNERKKKLSAVILGVNSRQFKLSEELKFRDWRELATLHASSRERKVEGFMLKRKDAPYETGRKRGSWWKWKVDPYLVDAVLVYAQKGHGRRGGIFSDYTFSVWDNDNLVPVAKAYSGLTDEEMQQVDRFVRENTKDKFGPVRSVTPELVFEIAFEDIRESSRHKSGVALRFPRISRMRTDKPAAEADSIETLKALLQQVEA